jgi:hypothetical protein
VPTSNASDYDLNVCSDTLAPFFIARIFIFLNRPADSDILLDSINIDGTGVIQYYGYSSTSKVIVVPAGLVVGEVTTSIPSNLNFLLVKNPLGNDAPSASGGSGNGVVIGLRFMSGAYNLGTTISAIALVAAPANTMITMNIC